MNTPSSQPSELPPTPRNPLEDTPGNTTGWVDINEAIGLALEEQRTKFMAVAIPLVLLLTLAVVALLYKYYRLSDDLSDKLAHADQRQQELTALRTEANDLRQGVKTLLADKIPGVREFTFNQDIELNDRYLKGISFYESNSVSGKLDGYQVRTTLFNGETQVVLPDIRLVYFNKKGYLMGYLHIGAAGEAGFRLQSLKPGQRRTDISDIISVENPDSMPAYFLVEVR
jgi:hypothetical protein